MMKFLLIIQLLFAHAVWSQDITRDLDFIETQNTLSTPWNFPIYIDLQGNISLISADKTADVSLNPLGQIQGKFNKSLYIKPVRSESFGFFEQRNNQAWIEIKRERGEFGLGAGIGGNVGVGLSLGLSGYKGARQVMIRTKATQKEKTKRPTLPDDLDEIGKWRNGDNGSFQRFGGIQVYAGASFSVVNILTVGLTIQNLWGLTINKVNDNKVILTLAEENLNKRSMKSGTTLANANINFFKGKRLTVNFILDPQNEEHRELYKVAMKGRIDKLQEKLPLEAQKLTWDGSERMAYYGIPGVAGKHFQKSHYVMEYDGDEEVLDIKTRRNSGLLLPLRSHNRMVYQTDDAMTIFWYSEMNKADHAVIDKWFLKPGRLLGVKGFENDLPVGSLIGATLSQLGMVFTREEIEKVDEKLLADILVNFEARCKQFDLNCGKPRKFRNLKKKLTSFLGQKWETYRNELGFLMVEWPVLVPAYLKSINAKKKIYFKFLNQKYQSLEGQAPIEY